MVDTILLINLTGIGNPNKVRLGIQRYMNTLFEVYVAVAPGYASFQILLPISPTCRSRRRPS